MEIIRNVDRYCREDVEKIKSKYGGIKISELLSDLEILYWDLENHQFVNNAPISIPHLSSDILDLVIKIKYYNAGVQANIDKYTKEQNSAGVKCFKKCKLL